MSTKTIGVGLIGCGRWGRHILRDLKTLGCAVHVVARSEQSIEHANQHQADSVVTELSALPTQLEGYVIAVPVVYHAEVIEQLLPTGRPIFCEKPLTSSAAKALELVRAAGDLIYVMDKWKYHNGIRQIDSLIRSGSLGEVLQISSSRKQWGCPHLDVDPVWVLAPHDISIAQHLLGQTPTAVHATGTRRSNATLDSLAGLMQAKDTRVLIDVSASHPVYQRELTVTGSKASVLLSGAYNDRLLMQHRAEWRMDAKAEEIPFIVNMPLYEELRCFVELLQGSDVKLVSTGQQGYETVRELEALREMALEG